MSNRNPLVVEITDRVGPKLSAALIHRLQDRNHPGITSSHAKVFEHLGDGARLTDLAERAQITKQSMGELVRSLERLGYVEREPDPADGRAYIVRATAHGADVMHQARRGIAQMYRQAQSKLGTKQMAQL